MHNYKALIIEQTSSQIYWVFISRVSPAGSNYHLTCDFVNWESCTQWPSQSIWFKRFYELNTHNNQLKKYPVLLALLSLIKSEMQPPLRQIHSFLFWMKSADEPSAPKNWSHVSQPLPHGGPSDYHPMNLAVAEWNPVAKHFFCLVMTLVINFHVHSLLLY